MHSDIQSQLAALGGIAPTRELIRRGIPKDAIRRAWQAGRILHVRRGIVAIAGTDRRIFRAARIGGALASVSAAGWYGMWTPHDPRLHVSVAADLHLGTVPREVVVLRDGTRLAASERFIVSPLTSAAQCIRTLPFDEAVAVLDSALHSPRDRPSILRVGHLARLRSQLPRRLHAVLDAVDARSESGAESLARIRLARVGITAVPQVWLTRGIRVDLLVGDRLVIELGSREFHADPEVYERDRARAAIIASLGFELLEFTASQVFGDWGFVETVVAGKIGAGAHLRATSAI